MADLELDVAPPGGPFLSWLRAVGLLRRRRMRAGRAALVLAAIAWVPLPILGALERLIGKRADPLLREPTVHVRALVAIPLLFVAELLLYRLVAFALDHFARGHFVDRADEAALEPLRRRGERLRDSTLVEAALFALAWLGGLAALAGFAGATGGFWHFTATPIRWSAVRVYYDLVSLPLYQLLLFRMLWRWLVWSWLVKRLARLRVRALAAHPDRGGGLQHLAEPVAAFAIMMLALGAATSGAFAGAISFQGAPLRSFFGGIALLGVVALVLGLGPLLAFTPALFRARAGAVRRYDAFALGFTRVFERRWIDHGADESVVGKQDVSALCDLQTVFHGVELTRLTAFGVRHVILVAVAVILPMLPLVALVVPLDELARRLAHSLLGGTLR